jgi:4-amino-4-deoxy-L-arabinose transferase-like glycosyltransferase
VNLLHLLPFDMDAMKRRTLTMVGVAVFSAVVTLVAMQEAAGAAKLALEPLTGRLVASLIVSGSLIALVALAIGLFIWSMKQRAKAEAPREMMQTVAALAPVALTVFARQKQLASVSGLLVVAALAYAAGRGRPNAS